MNTKFLFSALPALLIAFSLSGCGVHQPLPRLQYNAPQQMGTGDASRPGTPVLTSVTFEAGRSIGHSLTTYALMPGGYAMPITSRPSSVTEFNTEDQAVFVENLARILAEREIIEIAPPDSTPVAHITVKFLKIEHFPDMQDYVLDALVTARVRERTYEKVHHVSTIDSVNLVARMFQHAIDGRTRAAELLLTAVVPDLESWFSSPTASIDEAGAIFVPRPFETGAVEIVQFLGERYARPSTFWQGGISVRAVRPSPSVVVVELRWSDSAALPPFCTVDLYANGDGTRAVIRERDTLLTSRARVKEALQEFIGSVEN